MKNTFVLFALLSAVIVLSSCNGAFWGGAGGGTLATGASYEVNAKVKMDQLKKDLDAGRISQSEYDIRVDQIKKMSLAY